MQYETEIDPVMAHMPDSSLTHEDVQMLLDADQAAYDEWSARTKYERGEVSSELGDGFREFGQHPKCQRTPGSLWLDPCDSDPTDDGETLLIRSGSRR